MAKKASAKPRPNKVRSARKKKATGGFFRQMMKMVAGLALLMGAVVIGAVVANRLLPPEKEADAIPHASPEKTAPVPKKTTAFTKPESVPKPKPAPDPVSRQKPEPVSTQKPAPDPPSKPDPGPASRQKPAPVLPSKPDPGPASRQKPAPVLPSKPDPDPPSTPQLASIPKTRPIPEPPPVVTPPVVSPPAVPDYEAFHKETVPPPPLIRPKRVTNGLPVAIIIDDIGYDRKMADGFMALNVPITFSVLPHGTFNSSIVAKARKKGVELMLHLPMEPINYPAVNPGPGALFSSMTPDQLITQLNADLKTVPGIKGVNNHMGSRLTTSSDQMRQVFTILKKHDLFFVDSRTSGDSRCRPSAELLRIPFAERDVFLDHEQTPEFVRKQIHLLIQRAQKQGYAIAIGHPHPVTLEVLREMLPELEKNVSLSYASQVVAFQEG